MKPQSLSVVDIEHRISRCHSAELAVLHTLGKASTTPVHLAGAVSPGESGGHSSAEIAQQLKAPRAQVLSILENLSGLGLVASTPKGWFMPARVVQRLKPFHAPGSLPDHPRHSPEGIATPIVRNALASSLSTASAELSAVLAALGPVTEGLASTRVGTPYKVAVKSLATGTGLEVRRLIFWLHAAEELELLTRDSASRRWVRVSAYDNDWLPLDRSEQLLRLITAWLTSQQAPWSALGSAEVISSHAPEVRRAMLLTALDLTSGVAEEFVAVTPLIAEHMKTWTFPRLWHRNKLSDSLVSALIQEAHVLGIFAATALSPLGEMITSGKLQEVPALFDQLLPPLTETVTFLPDHTIVVPGTPTPQLAADLREFTEQVSYGAASVYRLTDDSLRRGMETAGYRTEDVVQLFREISDPQAPLPKTVEDRVADVSRRLEALAVGSATSWFRCDSPEELTGILDHPEVATLRLRRIAPTVAVTSLSSDQLHRRLTDLGLNPSRSAEDIADQHGQATRAQRRFERRLDTTRAAQFKHNSERMRLAVDLYTPVATVENDDAWDVEAEDLTPIELIRMAADHGVPLRIRWVNATGQAQISELSAPQIHHGSLVGNSQNIPLHRVLTAEPLDDGDRKS